MNGKDEKQQQMKTKNIKNTINATFYSRLKNDFELNYD